MATITVTNSNDSGVGSLRAALANVFGAGDIINFAANVTEIDLASTLTIAKNVTIEGSQPGSIGTPGVIINGGGASSNFSDFTIDAGVTATFDGLIIADGHATGAAGATGFPQGGAGGAAAGGIYDAGALTLSHSQLIGDTATGGSGGKGVYGGGGGGAGGSAAGGTYVASTGTLNLQSDSASANAATGGQGGSGGASKSGFGGAGGAGAVSGQSTTGSPGIYGFPPGSGGGGGAPGQPGQPGDSGGGGGGGGSAFADAGGAGTINGTITDTTTLIVTNNSDSATVFGSLRYELSIAQAGDTIDFAANVTEINLASTLTISENVTIEGSQPGSTGTPGVTIVGGGASSNFSDFTIDAGVTATFDGLIIADGHATGATDAAASSQGGTGGAAAGGIYDAGALTLSHSQLVGDTATGGSGGKGLYGIGGGGGGGAGGSAAGGIYVASTGTLNLQSDSASANAATGGQGGSGGAGKLGSGGAGGAGAVSGQSTTGSPGIYGFPPGIGGGSGGAPGVPGQHGGQLFPGYGGGGGGGGGGSAFADAGGAGTINGTITDTTTLIVTNNSDSATVFGSLRYELSIAQAGDTIDFAANVTEIDLASTLTISENVTIEGSQPGSTGTPGVTINGGGPSSNFADFTINAGVITTFDGLIIAGAHATGASGSYGSSGGTGGAGQAAAGGIYDAGTLTLTNSILENDTATGGVGGTGGLYNGGGGAGGNAAGAIYVASTGTLNFTTGDQFIDNSAAGGAGGRGGTTNFAGYSVGGGAGGAGGKSGVNGGSGQPGQTGSDTYAPPGLWGAGGAPDQPGSYGHAGGGGGGGNAFADYGGTGTINLVPCYCPGTLIKTARGDKRVEKLKIGDNVMTISGMARPIKWIGRRSYAGRFVIGRKDILPVCIRAGALDDNVPKRDLWISPHHAMYFKNQNLDGVLIEAKDLLNGISVVQAERVERVEYFHIELDSHDVIIAEGALSETYLDDDNRLMFHNAADYHALYQEVAAAPAHYCAPRPDEGYEVAAARQRIALRAGLLRTADGERIGSLRGSIDEAGAYRVAGWAQTADHPEAPVCLDIYADGKLIGQVLANRYRGEFEQAAIGTGHHGFEFTPPVGLDFATDTVEVRRSLDGAALEFGADCRRASQPLPILTTQRYPNVTVHRRAASG